MSANREPFLSVVTPVYNGEKFIEECIQSVLNQTYRNWEYVIVNNCSTDGTPEIINEYAKKDSRIRIHNNKKFLRNLENGDHAFKQMSPESKYCKVIHADDWMFPECLERMVAVAEEYPEVGIVSSYRLDDRKVNLDGLPYPSPNNEGAKIGRDYLLYGKYYFGSPSSLLIRSDLIRKREKLYDQSNVHSDVSACLDLLREADFGFVHQVLTFTRRHGSSVTGTIVKENFTYILSPLKDLVNYGPDFLSESEYKRRLKHRLRIFYARLATRIVMEKKLSFISGYKTDLRELGLEFSRTRLFLRTIVEIFRLLAAKIRLK